MRRFFCLVSLFSLTLSATTIKTEWLYYKNYPWVYDYLSSDWLYLQGSSDGKIYVFRNSNKQWEEFIVGELSWEQNYQHIWLPNPQPYGGIGVLQRIKEAKEAGVAELDLNASNITDLAPLADLISLQVLILANNELSDLSPLASLSNLTTLDLRGSTLISSEVKDLESVLPNTEIILPDHIIDDINWTFDPSNPPHAKFTELNSTVALEMIWVEPGTFTMGQNSVSDASPEHNVTLTQGFYLGKYEVTQAQYAAIMKDNLAELSSTPSNWPDNPSRPVEKVSWNDTQVFLQLLNSKEEMFMPYGWTYALPSESQWEYACRAGTKTTYSWGDEINASLANYGSSGVGETTEVGQYSPNPWGFHDMHGNVWEWTADWYAPYQSAELIDPAGPVSGTYKVDRGGAWLHPASFSSSAVRNYIDPNTRSSTIGFRVVLQKD